VASCWIERRHGTTGTRFRVEYGAGGRESRARYAGSFTTKREALARKAWVAGELAAMRVPDLGILAPQEAAETLRAASERWQASRVDVRESTKVQHRTALGRVLPILGARTIDSLTPANVAELVATLDGDGKARESIRKSVTALAMVLDFAGVSPNPARDRVQVRLPREEPEEPEPPSAEHVEAVAWLLPTPYLVALLVLDATGVRIGELEAAGLGDLDENRRAPGSSAPLSPRRGVLGGLSFRPTCTRSSSSGCPRVRTATPRRRSSPALRPTVCGWRSAVPAETPGCRTSPRTHFGTAASPSCTGKAGHGQRSAS
jgi:hypothetical protein